MRKILFIIISIPILFTACYEPAGFIIPKSAPIPIVNSLLISGKPIKVKLNEATPINSDNFESTIISDAKVVITIGDMPVTLPFDGEYYTIPTLLAEENTCYTLNITHKDFDDVSAQTCIPQAVVLDSLILSDSVSEEFYYKNFAHFYFQDNPNKIENYLISFSLKNAEYFPEKKSYNPDSGLPPDILFFIDKEGFYGSDIIINDSLFQGEYITAPLSFEPFSFEADSLHAEYSFCIYSVSQEYANLGSYNAFNWFDPDAEKYTNIINGKGIFAGAAISNSITWSQNTIFEKIWKEYY